MIKTLPFKDNAASLLEIFKDETGVSFLHSSQSDLHRGRFSFLGFDPFIQFQYSGPQSLKQLEERLAPFKNKNQSSLTPLLSGIIGFISYDYGLYIEKIKQKPKKSELLPDVCFGFYDTILTVDHFKNQLIISSTGLPEKGRLQKLKAEEKLDDVLRKIIKFDHQPAPKKKNINHKKDIRFKSNFSKQEYLHAVKRVLEYIRRGDIYQANLSQRFLLESHKSTIDPVKLYQNLMQFSPSPFSAYFDAGDCQIISSSPERFLKLKNRSVETRPMKGTRPRGKNRQEDKKFKKEINTSGKDRAELLMITDLERNDLGRVCEYGSVKVSDMRTIEGYKTVYQATSTIVGKLCKDKNGFDLIQAAFPGGSITGCPKIRAMEIIEEIEPTRRGLYTGSLGYINFNGDLDFNILIRTIVMNKNKIYFQVGGGIVSDSVPIKEYEETLVKARAINKCLKATLGN